MSWQELSYVESQRGKGVHAQALRKTSGRSLRISYYPLLAMCLSVFVYQAMSARTPLERWGAVVACGALLVITVVLEAIAWRRRTERRKSARTPETRTSEVPEAS